MSVKRIRVFISSPSDVRPERLRAEQIVSRLSREFSHHLKVESVLWEREPMVATKHFQDTENIPEPSACDIIVLILWSRLGSLLPAGKFSGAISLSQNVTGTEWEFENALLKARQCGKPQIVVYRKDHQIAVDLSDRTAVEEGLDQLAKLEVFTKRWFREDGDKDIYATHRFQDLLSFETLLYGHLQRLLRQQADHSNVGSAPLWVGDPFRALQVYEYEHAEVFVGRTKARNELRELLTKRIDEKIPFLIVTGGSGVGKSSLVRAGLTPDIMLPGMIRGVALVRRASMRPSDLNGDLFTALASVMLGALSVPETASGIRADVLADLLYKNPKAATILLGEALRTVASSADVLVGDGARLLLVIDQMEELFTFPEIDDTSREKFISAVKALAESGLVWIVASLRSDFYDRIETVRELAEISQGGRYLLIGPSENELGEIIRTPARMAGLSFERDQSSGLALDDAIQTASAKGQNCLPLLSFLMDQLWKRRSPTNQLTFTEFNDLGGVEGAIGHCAEEAFISLDPELQAQFAQVLRALVTIQGSQAVSRAARLDQFPTGHPSRALLDALVKPSARLLFIYEQAGRSYVRIAHEALLTHWPRANNQIQLDARDLMLRAKLEEETQVWQGALPKEKRYRTRAGLPLSEALALGRRWEGDLEPEVFAYIQASRTNARISNAKIALKGTFSTLAIIAILAGAILSAHFYLAVSSLEQELRFTKIKSGCFEKGYASDSNSKDPESTRRKTCIQQFELGTFEIRQDEWTKVMGLVIPVPSEFKGGSLPVDTVSWNNVQWFLFILNTFGHNRYRLPQEAEWEYAARAGTTTPYYWGGDVKSACLYENAPDRSLLERITGAIYVDCNDRFQTSSPVGSFKPNPWGLYDMLGNVEEMMSDCDRAKAKLLGNDGACNWRVVRGGSWNNLPRDLRVTYRRARQVDHHGYGVGFRIIRE